VTALGSRSRRIAAAWPDPFAVLARRGTDAMRLDPHGARLRPRARPELARSRVVDGRSRLEHSVHKQGRNPNARRTVRVQARATRSRSPPPGAVTHARPERGGRPSVRRTPRAARRRRGNFSPSSELGGVSPRAPRLAAIPRAAHEALDRREVPPRSWRPGWGRPAARARALASRAPHARPPRRGDGPTTAGPGPGRDPRACADLATSQNLLRARGV
jgi:hypothetical protein